MLLGEQRPGPPLGGGRLRAGPGRRRSYLCDEAETDRLTRRLWPDGATLDRDLIGRPATELAAAAGIDLGGREVTVLAARCADPWRDQPLLREKISPLLTLCVYREFGEAVRLVQSIAERCGLGHSCAVHTAREDRVLRLAEEVTHCRVVVNQSTMTNTGSLSAGVPFTTTLSAGSWGGSSVAGNVTWRHFLNHTTVSRPIPARVPDEAALFAPYRADTAAPSHPGSSPPRTPDGLRGTAEKKGKSCRSNASTESGSTTRKAAAASRSSW
ncbi:hypothetical protein ACFQVA_17120 [Actinomadura keratinilytica]